MFCKLSLGRVFIASGRMLRLTEGVQLHRDESVRLSRSPHSPAVALLLQPPCQYLITGKGVKATHRWQVCTGKRSKSLLLVEIADQSQGQMVGALQLST